VDGCDLNREGVFFFTAGDGKLKVRRWRLTGRLAGGATG